MAAPQETLYEVEEMLNQPGTSFNPQPEVVVIVDDSAAPDQEVFNNLEGFEGADWVRVSDDVPVDARPTAGGNVQFEGRQGGYETRVMFRHNNGYSTAYGHLSAFVKGLHAGQR
ncbi:M23 family peptidase, partial [Lacticaseibacillus rhamnosus]